MKWLKRAQWELCGLLNLKFIALAFIVWSLLLIEAFAALSPAENYSLTDLWVRLMGGVPPYSHAVGLIRWIAAVFPCCLAVQYYFQTEYTQRLVYTLPRIGWNHWWRRKILCTCIGCILYAWFAVAASFLAGLCFFTVQGTALPLALFLLILYPLHLITVSLLMAAIGLKWGQAVSYAAFGAYSLLTILALDYELFRWFFSGTFGMYYQLQGSSGKTAWACILQMILITAIVFSGKKLLRFQEARNPLN